MKGQEKQLDINVNLIYNLVAKESMQIRIIYRDHQRSSDNIHYP